MVHRGQLLCQPPKNWEYFVVASEAMIAYFVVDLQDNDSVANIAYEITRLRRDGNCPCLDLSELKQEQDVKRICLICDVCALEEAARRALKIKTPKMFSIKQIWVSYCEQFKLAEHNTV